MPHSSTCSNHADGRSLRVLHPGLQPDQASNSIKSTVTSPTFHGLVKPVVCFAILAFLLLLVPPPRHDVYRNRHPHVAQCRCPPPILLRGFGRAMLSSPSCISPLPRCPSPFAHLPPQRCPFGSLRVPGIKAGPRLVQRDAPRRGLTLPTGPYTTTSNNSPRAKSLSSTPSPSSIQSMTLTPFIASTPAPLSARIGETCRRTHRVSARSQQELRPP